MMLESYEHRLALVQEFAAEMNICSSCTNQAINKAQACRFDCAVYKADKALGMSLCCKISACSGHVVTNFPGGADAVHTSEKAWGAAEPEGLYWVAMRYRHSHTMPALQPTASMANRCTPAL